MTGRTYHLAIVALLGASAACSKKTPEPHAQPNQKIPQPRPAAVVSPDGKLDPTDPRHGTRRLMGLDTPVFVDGVQVAVLRAGELPVLPSLATASGAARYRVTDYLKAIGVAVDSVRSVHFHANLDRVASLERAELTKEPDRFLFQFLGDTTGVPVQRWDTDGLKNEFVANEFRKISVYVTKPSPPVHPQKRCHLTPSGECTNAVPYSNGEVAKGTRFYLDGKMIGFVKRRHVGDELAVGDRPDGDRMFSVSKLVAQMGVDPGTVSDVELVAGDDVIARATGMEFATLAPKMHFILPKHQHGKIKVFVPRDVQARGGAAVDRDGFVSAVMLYRTTKPQPRDLTAISEETDLSVQVAAMDGARDSVGRGER